MAGSGPSFFNYLHFLGLYRLFGFAIAISRNIV